MNPHQLDQWKHAHDFELHDRTSERRLHWVVGMTLVTMVAEITFGMLFGSMALLADGWHMGTHAAALGIAALAYHLARKYAQDRRFTFGTGKVGILGGYTSAVVLVVVALLMLIESVERLFSPQIIRFNESIAVALLGLAVNLASALLLQGRHARRHHGSTQPSSGHDHHEHACNDHEHHDPYASGRAKTQDNHHGHQDHNLRGAYLHVLADALTSLLAIVALTAGKFWHWVWMDPLMGIVGALIISHWARGLLRDSGMILLDRNVSRATAEQIVKIIESDADNRITDLHIWKVSAKQFAAIIALVTRRPQSPDYYKQLLSKVPDLAHITVEITDCRSETCL